MHNDSDATGCTQEAECLRCALPVGCWLLVPKFSEDEVTAAGNTYAPIMYLGPVTVLKKAEPPVET